MAIQSEAGPIERRGDNICALAEFSRRPKGAALKVLNASGVVYRSYSYAHHLHVQCSRRSTISGPMAWVTFQILSVLQAVFSRSTDPAVARPMAEPDDTRRKLDLMDHPSCQKSPATIWGPWETNNGLFHATFTMDGGANGMDREQG